MLIQPRLKHFFSEEERELAEVILKFEACGFPLSMYRVCLLAFQYAHINSIKGFLTINKNAGYKWARGYLARNPDIVLKKCSNISVARAMAANPTNIHQWFAKYLAVLEQFNIQSPEQIWSGYDTGVQNVPAVSKVLGHHNTTAQRQVSFSSHSSSSHYSMQGFIFIIISSFGGGFIANINKLYNFEMRTLFPFPISE